MVPASFVLRPRCPACAPFPIQTNVIDSIKTNLSNPLWHAVRDGSHPDEATTVLWSGVQCQRTYLTLRINHSEDTILEVLTVMTMSRSLLIQRVSIRWFLDILPFSIDPKPIRITPIRMGRDYWRALIKIVIFWRTLLAFGISTFQSSHKHRSIKELGSLLPNLHPPIPRETRNYENSLPFLYMGTHTQLPQEYPVTTCYGKW